MSQYPTLQDRLEADVFALDMAGIRAEAGTLLEAAMNGHHIALPDWEVPA